MSLKNLFCCIRRNTKNGSKQRSIVSVYGPSHHGCSWLLLVISLLLTIALHRRPPVQTWILNNHMIRKVWWNPKKKTSVGLLIFNSIQWMRSSQVVRAFGCQTRCRNSPGFDPSILQHSGIWRAEHEAKSFCLTKGLFCGSCLFSEALSLPLGVLLGMVKQFCKLQIWSHTECKSPAGHGLQYTTQQPRHTVYEYL